MSFFRVTAWCFRQHFVLRVAFLALIRNRVARETQIMVDESCVWNNLNCRYVVKVIKHSLAYSADSACTNGAELLFSRTRQAGQGITATLLAPNCAATPRNARGAWMIARRTTALKCMEWLGWPCGLCRAWTSMGIGNVLWFSAARSGRAGKGPDRGKPVAPLFPSIEQPYSRAFPSIWG